MEVKVAACRLYSSTKSDEKSVTAKKIYSSGTSSDWGWNALESVAS
jgi:hypothetical protein